MTEKHSDVWTVITGGCGALPRTDFTGWTTSIKQEALIVNGKRLPGVQGFPGGKLLNNHVPCCFTANGSNRLARRSSSTMANQESANPAHSFFDRFVQAQSCEDVKQHFSELCRQLDINPKDFRNFYSKLKERLNYWKAKRLWTKLDKRASHSEYQQRKACIKNKVLAALCFLWVDVTAPCF